MMENGRFRNLAVRTKCSIIAIAVTVLFLAANGPATAACEKSKRIRHNDSECLTASWTNRSWPSLSRVTVRNECSGYGTVVAKIDIKNAADRTLHLHGGDERTASGQFTVRQVSCCSDISDLCSLSGVVTDDSCLDRFHASSANETCRHATGTAISRTQCRITAQCRHSHMTQYFRTTITVEYPDVAKLHNCRSVLTNGHCPMFTLPRSHPARAPRPASAVP